MLVSYDLHLHSCLSPCGENEMTPNNIVGMAGILEVPVIAVSDHNSARNLPAVCRLGMEQGILVVPAIEINTAEEVHVLSLFPDVASALDMGEELYAALPAVNNQPDIFGDQLVMDENDCVVDQVEKLLINAVSFSIEAVFEKVRQRGGVPIPAHVDKSAYSVLSSLGFLPPELNAYTIEVSPSGVQKGFVLPGEGKHLVISDSDAHSLETWSMHEPKKLEIERISVPAILERLRGEEQV